MCSDLQTVASVVAWVVSVSAVCTKRFGRKTVEDKIRVTRITRTADGTSGDTFVMSSVCTCNKVWSHASHTYAHDSQVLEEGQRQIRITNDRDVCRGRWVYTAATGFCMCVQLCHRHVASCCFHLWLLSCLLSL